MNWNKLAHELRAERDRIDAVLAVVAPMVRFTPEDVRALNTGYATAAELKESEDAWLRLDDPEQILQPGGPKLVQKPEAVEATASLATLGEALEAAAKPKRRKKEESKSTDQELEEEEAILDAVAERLATLGPPQSDAVVMEAMRMPGLTSRGLYQAIFRLMGKGRIRKDGAYNIHLIEPVTVRA